MYIINVKTPSAPGGLSSGQPSKSNSILKSDFFKLGFFFHSKNAVTTLQKHFFIDFELQTQCGHNVSHSVTSLPNL